MISRIDDPENFVLNLSYSGSRLGLSSMNTPRVVIIE